MHTHMRQPPPAVEAVQANTTHVCMQHPMPLALSLIPQGDSASVMIDIGVSQAAHVFFGESRRVTVRSGETEKKPD